MKTKKGSEIVAHRKTDKEYEEEIFSYLKNDDFLTNPETAAEDWNKYCHDLEHLSELKAELKRKENLQRLAEIKDKIVLDTDDVQVIFNCGQRQAYEIMNLSSFPSFKLGTKLQVYREALEKWLSEQEYREIIL